MKDIIVYAFQIPAIQYTVAAVGMFAFTIIACLVGIPA